MTAPARLLALVLLLAATPPLTQPSRAQQAVGNPPAGDPAVQAPVPEVGAGRGGTGAGRVPASTEPEQPTGTATAPQPKPVIPTPVQHRAAPPAFGARGLDASELELQAELRGERITGRITIPDTKAASLIQPEGRDWRAFHNRTLTWVGAVAVLGMIALLTAFFLIKGRIRIPGGWSGRTLLRFSALERGNHWMVASSFIILGLTGLNLTFGRFLLLPLIGPEAFTAVSIAGKYAHNFLAFPFTLGLLMMFILWVRDNIPERADIDWLRQGGGLIGGGHPAAGRFNAGQKSVFWLTIGGGAVVAASGYVLIFPFTVTDIAGQQWAHMIHGVLAVLMFAAMLAHIYIGSLGMEGAFDAMGTGQVDCNWANEHHSLWVAEEAAKAAAAPMGAKAANTL